MTRHSLRVDASAGMYTIDKPLNIKSVYKRNMQQMMAVTNASWRWALIPCRSQRARCDAQRRPNSMRISRASWTLSLARWSALMAPSSSKPSLISWRTWGSVMLVTTSAACIVCWGRGGIGGTSSLQQFTHRQYHNWTFVPQRMQ